MACPTPRAPPVTSATRPDEAARSFGGLELERVGGNPRSRRPARRGRLDRARRPSPAARRRRPSRRRATRPLRREVLAGSALVTRPTRRSPEPGLGAEEHRQRTREGAPCLATRCLRCTRSASSRTPKYTKIGAEPAERQRAVDDGADGRHAGAARHGDDGSAVLLAEMRRAERAPRRVRGRRLRGARTLLRLARARPGSCRCGTSRCEAIRRVGHRAAAGRLVAERDARVPGLGRKPSEGARRRRAREHDFRRCSRPSSERKFDDAILERRGGLAGRVLERRHLGVGPQRRPAREHDPARFFVFRERERRARCIDLMSLGGRGATCTPRSCRCGTRSDTGCRRRAPLRGWSGPSRRRWVGRRRRS